MAYDRYDTRRERERSRFSDSDRDREGFGRDERGFFERAGDEIASWFGDEEAERRRLVDDRTNRGWRGERDSTRDRYTYGGWGGEPDRERHAYRGSRVEANRGRFEDEGRDRRPTFRGYERDLGLRGYASTGWGGAFTGSDYDRDPERGRDRDYRAWRQRQLDELDRDYDEYRMENRERFERDFGTWRQNRQHKRGFLGQIREHMDVVGSDGETIGKVDCIRGDHIVLTKADSPDNRHHLLSCGTIAAIEGDEVRLDIPAEEAKSRWKDEAERGFFGREGEGEVNLERSFSGTYR
ncbi:MAG TPA: DUF2171 domain-containing protein [Sphingomicrobium sp.]|nr:DUF2171 domain-containing protein [Sphingomicrobium sp.]